LREQEVQPLTRTELQARLKRRSDGDPTEDTGIDVRRVSQWRPIRSR
jgi:hypothetical protein